MSADIDFLGAVNLLRRLRQLGLITTAEYRRITARIAAQSGAKIIIYP